MLGQKIMINSGIFLEYSFFTRYGKSDWIALPLSNLSCSVSLIERIHVWRGLEHRLLVLNWTFGYYILFFNGKERENCHVPHRKIVQPAAPTQLAVDAIDHCIPQRVDPPRYRILRGSPGHGDCTVEDVEPGRQHSDRPRHWLYNKWWARGVVISPTHFLLFSLFFFLGLIYTSLFSLKPTLRCI